MTIEKFEKAKIEELLKKRNAYIKGSAKIREAVKTFNEGGLSSFEIIGVLEEMKLNFHHICTQLKKEEGADLSLF